MRRNIGDEVHAPQHTARVNEKRVPLGERRVLVVGRPHYAVGVTHGVVDVAQEGVVEPLGVRERHVLRGCIERRSDDHAVRAEKLFGIVTQSLALDRSTRGRCLRIPPQQHPSAVEVGQADLVAMLVRKTERWSECSLGEHDRESTVTCRPGVPRVPDDVRNEGHSEAHLSRDYARPVLTAFVTHNPEDLHAYYGRALPELQRVAKVVLNPLARDLEPHELIAAATDCDVIIAHRATPGGAEVFASLPRLTAFLRCAVDISTIDVPAASRAGVLIAHADKSFIASTAELALALMLDVARNVSASTIDHQQGRAAPQRTGRQLRGRTVGIIGYGSIGRYLAQLLRDVGMQVAIHDPGAEAAVISDRFEALSLPQLLGTSEFVLPLAPSNPSTHNLINAETLALMRRGSLLVNVSRGELLDEDAVAAALDSGHLGGLAMDVGRAPDQRPSPALARRPGVVATPHLGGLTPENADAQAMSSVEQVKAIATGIEPPRSVNVEHATRLRTWWNANPANATPHG